MCKLLEKVNTDEIGNRMIENFKNVKNKWCICYLVYTRS